MMTPSQYHVVFFDNERHSVTRAWVQSRFITKFSSRPPGGISSSYSDRVNAGCAEARQAQKIELLERRKQFGLLARFRGFWGRPWPDCQPKERSKTGERLEHLAQEMIPNSEELLDQIENLDQSRSSDGFNRSVVENSCNFLLDEERENTTKATVHGRENLDSSLDNDSGKTSKE